MSVANLPSSKLRDDVRGSQPHKPGYPGLHPSEPFAMAGNASWTDPLRITAPHQMQATSDGARRCGIGRPRYKRRLLFREILRDLLQIGFRKISHQIVHRRVVARAILERDELVEEITRWFAGDPREITIIGALTALSMAGDT